MLSPEELAEIEELRAALHDSHEANDYLREQLTSERDRNSDFINELCMLIPDERDDDVAAEAIVIDWVKGLLTEVRRLTAALPTGDVYDHIAAELAQHVDADDYSPDSAASVAYNAVLPLLVHLDTQVRELTEDRDRARGIAVVYEQQLGEIERLAYMGGQSAHSTRRSILRVFEEAKQ